MTNVITLPPRLRRRAPPDPALHRDVQLEAMQRVRDRLIDLSHGLSDLEVMLTRLQRRLVDELKS